MRILEVVLIILLLVMVTHVADTMLNGTQSSSSVEAPVEVDPITMLTTLTVSALMAGLFLFFTVRASRKDKEEET